MERVTNRLRPDRSYALAVMFKDLPGKIFVARKDSPMIIGVNENEAFLASDVPAILKYTRNVYYIDNLQVGRISPGASNVKSDKTLVCVKNGDEVIETGLKKFAAIVGDNVEVGCQSVLNPGTVIGRGCRVYPLSRVRGVIPEKHIFKDKDEIVPIEE